jgi:hypothetical protein
LKSDLLDDVALLVPALGYFAFAMTTDINLGYRHLLPMLPFLAVFTANSLSSLLRSGRTAVRWAVPALLVWLLAVAVWISPHFLSYFNALAGGPDNGWRALVDSNIDWGQDLGGLKSWMDENGVEQVYLSYFGEGRPEYYGIGYVGLDSWPPRLMNPEARPFYPQNPAPGLYAISATTLQGVHFDDHDRFAWFRDREPLDKVGYSIFLYEIAPTGDPVDLALGGVQMDEIDPADFALLGTNDVTPHWFDPAQSWLLPENGGFVALAAWAEPPEWAHDWQVAGERPSYTLYRYPPQFVAAGTPFSLGDGTVLFLGAEGAGGTVTPGQTLSVKTSWLKSSPPEPVKIFIHLIAPDGSLAAQWDGLGAPWEGWRGGDLLNQTHQLAIPEGSTAGVYELRAGLYHPETAARWMTPDGSDYVKLGDVTIP